MHKTFIFSIVFLSFCGITRAQGLPQARELINPENIHLLKSQGEGGQIIAHDQEGETVFRVETIEQPKFIYNLNKPFPLKAETLGKERVLLFSFLAKTESSSEETGEAKALFMLKQSPSYKDNLVHTVDISSHWQQYYLPFKTNERVDKSDLALILQYGFSPQSFLIKDVSLKLFPKGTDLADLPKTPIKYAGMEANAPWRKEADARIEKLRKGDFEIIVTRDGKPLDGATVALKLKRHAFPFGAMMHADDILDNPVMYDKFKNAFSLTVLGNDLKIKSWSQPDKRKRALEAIKKLKADNITLKGHVLVWPGFQYNPAVIKNNKDNPDKIKKIIKDHVVNILDATKGDISHWDVVNETYTNKDFQKSMGGEDFLYDAFAMVQSLQPEVKRFTNEYGIISKGGIDEQKQQWYYEYIKRVDAHVPGAVQGVGIQSHMGSDLTPPEKVLSILSYYATLGKQISISEFTMDIQEPEIREQYTRDFMRVAFSHPNVSEFMFWGFQDDGRGKVDIYEKDGSLGAMGRAYFSLINGEWTTVFSAKANKNGTVKGRGFYGLYEYAIEQDGVLKKGYLEVFPQKSNTIEIKI